LDFKNLIAKYITGNLPPENLPSIALEYVKEGYNSSSLLILAGLDKNDGTSEIDKYFRLALQELNIIIPDKRLAVLQCAYYSAVGVLEGKEDIFWGIMGIISILKKYDFYSETKHYVYDSIFFEHVYGLFDQYDDLVNSWVDGKSDENFASSVKMEMFAALKSWCEKIRPYINK